MRKFVLLLGCFAATPLAAGETKLNGEAIKATLGGSLLAIDTPVGSTVSVRINHDGLMSGEAGTALGTVLGASKDRGRWWVLDNQVCFKWFRWFDAEARCATITVDGSHFTWRREDGDTGTGTIVEAGDKQIAKPAVVVAKAEKKPPAAIEKAAERKIEVAKAANRPEAEADSAQTPTIAAKAPVKAAPPAPTRQTPVILTADANAPRQANQPATEAIPTPRPAVRPKLHANIAVATVKPQFFTASKAPPAKARVAAQKARVQVAKVDGEKAKSIKTSSAKPFRVAGVDPADVLNIRNGPSPDYQSVGGIPSDSHGITITGPCQNEWCPVKHRTLVGWVNRRYLAEETASNSDVAFTGAEYFAP